jgi:predicted amidophosphoribosyltransferase
MVSISPKPLTGPWKEGFALDLHTVSSELVGYNEWGHEVFDTKRSEMGELLYQLKYQSNKTVVRIIAETVVEFIRKQSWGIDLVVPVPPSSQRVVQPVLIVAEAIANTLGVPYCSDCVVKVRETPQLKNIYDLSERSKLLKDAFTASKTTMVGKTILLFDDLYRSGATLQAVASALVGDASLRNTYALVLTMTRTRR